MPRNLEHMLPQSHIDEKSPTLMQKINNMPALKEAIDRISWDYLTAGELNLQKTIRARDPDNAFPRLLGLLKVSFWEEYRRSIDQERLMSLQNVLDPVCSIHTWTRHVLNDEVNLAWLITPPPDEVLMQKEIIQLAMVKIREAMEAPLITKRVQKVRNKDGSTHSLVTDVVNVQLLAQIHSILKTMQDRVHGSIVHRAQIAQKTHIVTGAEMSLPKLQQMDPDTLHRLESKLNEALAVHAPKPGVPAIEGEVLGDEDDEEDEEA